MGSLNRVFHRLGALGLTAAIGALSSGCGNLAGPRSFDYANTDIGADNSSLQGVYGPEFDEYVCPESLTENIAPRNFDGDLDGSDRYMVCRHQSDAAKIGILGLPSESDGICVFPVQYVDSSHVYYKALTPFCTDTNEEGMFAQFDNMTYNAVIVVHREDKLKMQECITRLNASSCPRYSYGRFR